MSEDDPLLPGADSGVSARRARSGSFGLVAAGGLVAAVVLGLGAGALWGLNGRPSVVVAPVTSPAPTLPTSPVVVSPGRTPTGPSSPSVGPTLPGGYPPAPAASSQTSRRWHVGSWRITNTDGHIGMQATVTNGAGRPRAAALTMYLYVAGTPLARLVADVPELAAHASTSVTFTSTDPWGPGTKTLLLVAG